MVASVVRELVKELGQGAGLVSPALQPAGMRHRHRRRSLKVAGAKGIAHSKNVAIDAQEPTCGFEPQAPCYRRLHRCVASLKALAPLPAAYAIDDRLVDVVTRIIWHMTGGEHSRKDVLDEVLGHFAGATEKPRSANQPGIVATEDFFQTRRSQL